MKFVELLDGIDKNWSIKEKARYLYTKIAKNITYDERFSYSQNKKLLNEIYNREINIEEDEDTRLICRSSNLVYKQLLDKLGIKSELIYKKPSIEKPIEVEDVALIFWDEKGNKYYTNISGDIESCRFGVKTEFFGRKENLYKEAEDVEEIPNEELKEIDKKIGYIKYDYNNIVFELLANEVKNTNNFKRFLRLQGIDTKNMTEDDVLRNKIQYLNKLIKFRDKTAGPNERKQFYKVLFHASALDKFESKKFSTYEYIKENGEEVDILSAIKINLEHGPIYYIYSESEQTYIQTTIEEIKEKTKDYREVKNKKIEKEQNEKNGEEK